MALNRMMDLKPDLIFTYSLSQQTLSKKLKEKGFSVVHLDPYLLREVEDGFTQTRQGGLRRLGRTQGKCPGISSRELAALSEKNSAGRLPAQAALGGSSPSPSLVPCSRWWPDLTRRPKQGPIISQFCRGKLTGKPRSRKSSVLTPILSFSRFMERPSTSTRTRF